MRMQSLAILMAMLLAFAGPQSGGAFAAGSGGGTAPSGGGSDRPQGKPAEYKKALKLIKDERCEEALPLLEKSLQKSPNDADIWNYYGYCNRKTGKLDIAYAAYQEALKINPRHRGAREYLGELFLMQGDLAGAEAQLAELAKICPNGCDEREELEAEIAAYKAKAAEAPVAPEVPPSPEPPPATP